MHPERPAPGDKVELVGRNLTFSGCTVKVRFTPGVEVDPTSASATSVRAVVPAEGRIGEVRVLRTCPEGTGVRTVDSNPLPVLVIWRESNPWFSHFDKLHGSPVFPPPWPNGVLAEQYGFGLRFGLVEAENGLPLRWVQAGGFLGSFERSRLISYVAVTNSSGGSAPFAIWYYYDRDDGKTYRGILRQGRVDWVLLLRRYAYPSCRASDYFPVALGGGADGKLIVGAIKGGLPDCPQSWFGLWAFPSNVQSITLDPNNEYSLTPGGMPGLFRALDAYLWNWDWWWSQIVVAGDGTVFFPVYEAVPFGSYNFYFRPWVLRAKPGEPPMLLELPFGEPTAPCTVESWRGPKWHLAVDCKGNLLGVFGRCRWDDERPWSGKVWLLPAGVLAAQLNHPLVGSTTVRNQGVATDRYGNIYVLPVDMAAEYGPSGKVVRVLPSELVGHEYCSLSRPTNDACKKCGATRKVFLRVFDLDGQAQRIVWEGDRLEVPLGVALRLEAHVCQPAEPRCDNRVEASFSLQNHAVVQGIYDGIFPDKVAFFFGPDLQQRIATEVSLQTVHLGECLLRIQASGSGYEDVPPLEVSLRVQKPQCLGKKPNQFDATIADVAHAYGIPPQVIKAQVKQESNFIADRYRYEARTEDYGRFERGGLFTTSGPGYEALRAFAVTPDPRCEAEDCGICTSQVSFNGQWNFAAIDYLGGFPNGDGQRSCNFWECKAIREKKEWQSLWKVVEGNDGWVPCSPPWLFCNRGLRGVEELCERASSEPPESVPGEQKGPCGDRERWWSTREGGWRSWDPMERVIWCGWGKNAYDCSNEGVSVYLLNDAPKKKAQRLVAASYGLLQILYTTAVTTLKWRWHDDGGSWPSSPTDVCERNPDYLLEPSENLTLGVGYLTKLLRKKAMGGKEEKLFASRAEFEAALKKALAAYNGGPGSPQQAYANSVWAHVADYKPSLKCNSGGTP